MITGDLILLFFFLALQLFNIKLLIIEMKNTECNVPAPMMMAMAMRTRAIVDNF